MVRLRLTRTGRKNQASYRVIAIDSKRSRDSKALEFLGYYQPHEKKIELNADRLKYWLSVGAQPSDTVLRLLSKQGVVKKSTVPKVKFSKKPGRKALERAEQKAGAVEQAKAAKESKPAKETVEKVKPE